MPNYVDLRITGTIDSVAPVSTVPTPDSIGGLEAWFRGDRSTLTVLGGRVSSWLDKGPHGRHLTQPIEISRPTHRANQLNGHGVLRFDGVTNYMKAANVADWTFLHGGAGCSVFIVARLTSLAADKRQVFFSTTAQSGTIPGARLVHLNGGASMAGVAAEVFSDTETVLNHISENNMFPGQIWKMLNWQFKEAQPGPDSGIFVDGGTASSTETIGLAVNLGAEFPLLIGGSTLDPPILDPLEGAIAEMIFYSRYLTTSERFAVLTYLADRYNLTIL